MAKPIHLSRMQSKSFDQSTMHHDEWYTFPPHCHQGHFELVCMHEGAFEHTVNGQRHLHDTHMLFLIRADDEHALAGKGFRMTNIRIANQWLSHLEDLWGGLVLQKHLLERGGCRKALLDKPTWTTFERSLHRLNLPQSEEARNARFSQLLINVLLDHFLQPDRFDTSRPAAPGWFQELLTWIESRRGRPIRVEDVVEQANRCSEHVARSFRRYLGVSPSQYLNRQRLEQARHLLLYTDFSILEVGFEVGFDNPSYFHRLFRKEYGATPNAYRLAHGQRGV